MLQQKHEEDVMRSSLLEEIKLNPLIAYTYIIPIIAANPHRPTIQELAASRLIMSSLTQRILITTKKESMKRMM